MVFVVASVLVVEVERENILENIENARAGGTQTH